MKHFRKKKECTGILVNENDFVIRNGKVWECGASWSAGHSLQKTQTFRTTQSAEMGEGPSQSGG